MLNQSFPSSLFYLKFENIHNRKGYVRLAFIIAKFYSPRKILKCFPKTLPLCCSALIQGCFRAREKFRRLALPMHFFILGDLRGGRLGFSERKIQGGSRPQAAVSAGPFRWSPLALRRGACAPGENPDRGKAEELPPPVFLTYFAYLMNKV